MAKAQGKKKAAGTARRATGKVAARLKSAAHAIKKRVTAKPAASAAKKTAKPAKSAKPAKAKPAKTAAKPKGKPAPKKTAGRPAKEAKAPTPAKRSKRPAAVIPAKAPAVPATAPKVLAAPRAVTVAEPKKRTRRTRPRVHSNGAPVANWLPPGAEKPRPSSFIPAPARAEAPSLVAAPPASSDRLIRPEDVTEFVTRTVPIRVDVEQAGGRIYIHINPDEMTLRPGEGIEWDFRYLGGADISIDELVIEFEKPAPFSHLSFRSRRPGAARPHRQLSGPVQKSAIGKRIRYVIRAFNQFKTELATIKPVLIVVA